MPKINTSLLTDKEIKSFNSERKSYTKPDTNGLRILIQPDGRKIWEFVYLSPTLRKRRKTTFGTYPKTSLKEARNKRETYAKLISQGIDPIDEKKEVKIEEKRTLESSFSNVVNLWLNAQESRLGKETFKRKKALFENFVVPVFRDRSIADITHKELTTILEVKAQQHPETARRLFANFDDLWRYACSREYCNINITANIHRRSTLPQPKIKHYPKITDPIILKELVKAIYSYGGHYSSKNALKLVLHVPLRASNLVTLRWAYIDFDNQSLTIPRAEMKSKNADQRDFMLPLTDEAISILKEQYLFTSHLDYVFHINGTHLNQESPNMALKRLGFGDEVNGRKQTIHSFRGTFRSLADTHQREHKCSFEAKEKVLDHSVGDKTERAYTHQAIYYDEIKILLTWWSEYVLKMVDEVRK
ncbi:MAG: integrase arm-type DNA-binding domain-containing protein [Sulfurospirillaceae bacterium]|nr:integrase arm-type DNA-binding domain-containing protein [Sulfurospirillaceae bacterium]MDD2827709.1 integrase arm-type DNA-binding domain-containing protein [Sulfurospirillaceae bacterium]